MVELARRREWAAHIGRLAAAHVSSRHTPARVAGQVAQCLAMTKLQ
jgi:hypothetical protein